LNKGRVEIIEHTGDIGIRLSASSREELFYSAAMAMVHLIYPSAKILSKNIRTIKVSGDDDEQLLVNWLSEINFHFQTEQFLPAEILTLEIENRILKAVLSGDKIKHKNMTIQNDIKAVTYHKLLVKQENDFWSCQVIFDV
jgi:SHS2 domain-containing protein